jgi:hypothetical protein
MMCCPTCVLRCRRFGSSTDLSGSGDGRHGDEDEEEDEGEDEGDAQVNTSTRFLWMQAHASAEAVRLAALADEEYRTNAEADDEKH